MNHAKSDSPAIYLVILFTIKYLTLISFLWTQMIRYCYGLLVHKNGILLDIRKKPQKGSISMLPQFLPLSQYS